MADVQVPNANALRGGQAVEALEVATCPIREMAGVVSAADFAYHVHDNDTDVLLLQLQHSRLYMVGSIARVGYARSSERHVWARWAAHDVQGQQGHNRDIDFFVGPSLVPEEDGSHPWSWYQCPDDDLPYTNFRGVPGTNLWLKVNDLSLIYFHPMYESLYDGLHEIWVKIYTSMIGLVAPVVMDRANSAGGWRSPRERDEGSTDEESTDEESTDEESTDADEAMRVGRV